MTETLLTQTPNDPFGLDIAVFQRGTTTTIALQGEWDLAQQPATLEALRQVLDARPKCVVLELSRLSFIDSSGLHTIIELQKRCAQRNIRLVIIPGPRAVQRPFEICGLTEILPFLPAA